MAPVTRKMAKDEETGRCYGCGRGHDEVTLKCSGCTKRFCGEVCATKHPKPFVMKPGNRDPTLTEDVEDHFVSELAKNDRRARNLKKKEQAMAWTSLILSSENPKQAAGVALRQNEQYRDYAARVYELADKTKHIIYVL